MLSGKSSETFSIGKIKFKANPLMIEEWTEFQGLIGTDGEYKIEPMCEYLADKLAARKVGRSGVEIDLEWVKDNLFFCKINDLCEILTHNKTPSGVPASEFSINTNDCEDWISLGAVTPLDFKALPYTVRERLESLQERTDKEAWEFVAKLLRTRLSGLKDPSIITAEWVTKNVQMAVWDQMKYFLVVGEVYAEPQQTPPDQKKIAG